ncbi:MAG: TGS domain-containing protein [Euryarchaeota archaeon]|nr:TGS domain-containing protein [Euryarchaeota archaeon]
MATLEERIRAAEAELKGTIKNKHTEGHIGVLYRKIADLKSQLEHEKKKSRASRAGREWIRKSGDATVAFVGPPGTGKTTLLRALSPEATDQDSIGLGSLLHQGANIQLLDIPRMSPEALSLLRTTDLVAVVVDPYTLVTLKSLRERLAATGLRLDKPPPDITLIRRETGGLTLSLPRGSHLTEAQVRRILKPHRLFNADLTLRGPATEQDLQDSIEGNKVYLPSLTLMARRDLNPDLRPPKGALALSAQTGQGLPEFRGALWERLRLLRVYLKPLREPVAKDPMILRQGATLRDVCQSIHTGMADRFKYAQVWGKSVKHEGQRVGLDHPVADGDIVTIVSAK